MYTCNFLLPQDLTDIDMDLEYCNPNRRVGELPPSDRYELEKLTSEKIKIS